MLVALLQAIVAHMLGILECVNVFKHAYFCIGHAVVECFVCAKGVCFMTQIVCLNGMCMCVNICLFPEGATSCGVRAQTELK